MKPAVRIAEKDFLPRQGEHKKNGQLPAKTRPKAEPPWADELAKQVEENLWSRLPLVRWLRLGFRDLEHVVEIYVESVHELQIAHEQGNAFFREVCHANFELRCADAVESSARETILRREMADFEGAVKLPPERLDETLRADLACLDLAVAIRQLKQALRRQTHLFVQQFVAACKNAAGREIIGMIEWRKEFVACVLHFFRRVVVVNETKQQTKTGKKKVERLADRHGYATVTEEVMVQKGTAYEIRHAQHELHLISAKRHPLDVCPVPIPASHKALVEAVPIWLRPFVEVVDGTRIYERVVEFEKKKKVHETQQKFEREAVVFVGDPALTFGNYVLSAWGTQDVNGTQPTAAAPASGEIFSPFVLLILMAFMAGAVMACGVLGGVVLWLLGSLGVMALAIPTEHKKLSHEKGLAWGLFTLAALAGVVCGLCMSFSTGQKIHAAGAIFVSLVALYGVIRCFADWPENTGDSGR